MYISCVSSIYILVVELLVFMYRYFTSMVNNIQNDTDLSAPPRRPEIVISLRSVHWLYLLTYYILHKYICMYMHTFEIDTCASGAFILALQTRLQICHFQAVVNNILLELFTSAVYYFCSICCVCLFTLLVEC